MKVIWNQENVKNKDNNKFTDMTILLCWKDKNVQMVIRTSLGSLLGYKIERRTDSFCTAPQCLTQHAPQKLLMITSAINFDVRGGIDLFRSCVIVAYLLKEIESMFMCSISQRSHLTTITKSGLRPPHSGRWQHSSSHSSVESLYIFYCLPPHYNPDKRQTGKFHL